MASNLHQNNISINSEDESFEEVIEVNNGEGTVTRTPISVNGEYVGYVTYGEVINEEISFDGKNFSISDINYNGNVTISYFAKKFLILKIFSLFVSGIAQVELSLVNFISKCVTNISCYLSKNINLILTQKWFNINVVFNIIKNIYYNIKLNFKLILLLFSEKYSRVANVDNFDLIAVASSKKYPNSNILFFSSMESNLIKIRHKTISDYTGITISDLGSMTLFQFMYEEL